MSHDMAVITLVTCWVPLGTVTPAGQGQRPFQKGPGGGVCSENVYWMNKQGSRCTPAQQCVLMGHLLYARLGAGVPSDLIAALPGRSNYYPISQRRRLRIREVRSLLKGTELGLGQGHLSPAPWLLAVTDQRCHDGGTGGQVNAVCPGIGGGEKLHSCPRRA